MKIRFIDTVNGNLLYALFRLVKKTCRYQVSGFEYFQSAFSSGRTVIGTGWHGFTTVVLPFAAKHQDFSTFVTLMPDDWRGASLKVFTERLGAVPFPMNLEGDNTLGMGRQMVKLVKQVINNKNLFIIPDGPDGPSHVIKPGLTYIAKKANAVILPYGGYARHAYIVPRWDRYVVPYPFSRVSLCFGEPYTIPPETEDLTEIDEHLGNLIHRVTMQAAANYYEVRGKSRPL